MERGYTLWFTGLSGAGKTTLAHLVASELRARGRRVEILDGDVVRTHLSKGLGFTREDRDTNILRIGFVSGLLARNGVISIVAAISPYRETRERVRAQLGDFVEVYVECPIDECVRRDVKGLYRQALDGALRGFTGISDPYEPPTTPAITITTATQSPAESAREILEWLEQHSYAEAPGRQLRQDDEWADADRALAVAPAHGVAAANGHAPGYPAPQVPDEAAGLS